MIFKGKPNLLAWTESDVLLLGQSHLISYNVDTQYLLFGNEDGS